MRATTDRCRRLLVFACALAAAVPLGAVVVPERTDGVAEKAFRHPSLVIPDDFRRPAELPAPALETARRDLAALGVADDGARIDRRGGRWGTLMPATPLLPGAGDGNHLGWPGAAAPAAGSPAFERAAWQAFSGWLNRHRGALRLDPAELPRGRVTASGDGSLVQIHAPRTVAGVPVRDAYVTAVLRHGNLVLFGAQRWGDVRVSTIPALTAEEALARVEAGWEPWEPTGSWAAPELTIVPVADGPDAAGYAHRLAWTLRPTFEDDLGRWEALVDAHSGELLLFEDTNHYATTRRVQGGVLPVSNDGVAPDGVEQAGWPMPFADLTFGGSTVFTDAGGNLATCVDGNVTSTLSGRYVRMNDLCGSISLTSAGNVDFGTSAGTNCTTPGFGGAGNTHASRSGFHELSRIQEMARGQLPGNVWLNQQLTANMNINSTCNAFWNGATVNFYRAGGGCANTGELAGVFDHEWGHGMDDNDAVPTVSNPGEGIADIYTALRLNNSCIGRNFRPGVQCGGYGDPCTACTGVRDIDFAKRASGQPHDIDWAGPACGSGGGTPCGGSTHCEGYVYSEAVWDLVHRDLPSVYGMDGNTALEVGTRLTYLGAGNVGTWFQCTTPFGGCAATGGYLNYLAADDDNGNLADGTPHMQAIFAAFDRHQIACGSPAVADSGCAGAPATAPSVTGTAVDRGASLSWGAVAGAAKYGVYRTDGVFACDFGKVKVGETAGTSFVDGGLQNGRAYSYVVIPIGGHDTCMGPASACTTVTAAAGPNLSIDPASSSLAISTGDGDEFLDNCESATLSFDVVNIGTGTQTNVEIVSVVPVSHPSIAITGDAVAPSTLADCAIGSGSFDFIAAGLAHGDTVQFDVTVTSDQLSPFTRTASLFVNAAESDFQAFASKTFGFETDAEGWQVIEGTFARSSSGGGANGTSWYEASSANLPDQCDHVRSPVVRLSSTSTLSLWTQFDIEPVFQGSTWYDRANVGRYHVATGVRTPVSPSSGRLYNAGGANGTCGTTGQPGWGGAATSWAQSNWSAAALGSAGAAGDLIQLDVRYGTDGLLQGFGLHFDQVTLTDVDLQVPDTQSDSCEPSECGNGVREGAEECDGLDLGGATCGDVGCSSGTVACTATCTLDYSGCTDCVVCADGECQPGEDCVTCPTDCPTFPIPGASCGNGLCEAGDGENCVTCPADCNGVQSGKPANRFCCGFGGTNPVGCGDSRCTSGGFSCTTVPAGPGGSTCCGDLVCESPEDGANCPLDCGGGCDPSEVGLCTDGLDNDCDGFVDCADSDCGGDPACSGGPVCGNGTCESGENCNSCSADCDGRQSGPPSGRFCCGDGTPQGPEGDGTICDGNF